VNIFIDEHIGFLKLMNTAKVEFLLIGGYAVINYGYKRTTGDMDVWLKPDNANKEKLIPVLRELGFNEEGLKSIAGFNFEKPIAFHFWQEPARVDCLTHISGVSFEEAYKQKVVTDVEGLLVPFINYNHLILSKITTNRLKDKADIEELQKIQTLKNKKK
jgi:predicted nucleotidyltransferase